MTQPTNPPADLSRLRINRDAPPPGVKKAVIRNLVLLLVLVALVAAAMWYMRGRAVPVVQVTTVGTLSVAARKAPA